MFYLLRPVRFLAKAVTSENTPRQLAFGFALGLLIGLVPKGNLIAIVLMMMLGAMKVNLGAGMLAAFAFSWVGLLTDPLTHRIGLTVLEVQSLRPFWTGLYNIPLMPWTHFNNTVVLGSFLLGTALLYPAYRLSEPLFAKYTPRLEERLRKFKVVQLLWGTEWAGRLGSA
jgi:uncharacterized protein (TIGR03546 family)